MASRIEFYVLEEPSPNARLRVACRLAEKAYLAGETVVIWNPDAAELGQLDELLWTFADGSFVPHETLASRDREPEAPVLLTAGTIPSGAVDLLINLGSEVPAGHAHAERLADIIDGDETRRRAGRERFRAYRDMGLKPETHRVTADG